MEYALFRCVDLGAVGAAAVSKQARSLDIVAGPFGLAPLANGGFVGQDFDDVVAGLAGAVVAGRAGERAEQWDAMTLMQGRTAHTDLPAWQIADDFTHPACPFTLMHIPSRAIDEFASVILFRPW